MGDHNAKLSGDRRGIPTSVGPHGSADDINDNGERLLSLGRVSSGLSIGNTFFKHKRTHKKTCSSPDGNTSNEIDFIYICINNRRSSLPDVRAYRGADVASDHNLVIGKIHMKLKKATKPEVKKTYVTKKFKEGLYRIWCGVCRLGDSGVYTLGDTSDFVNPAGQLLLTRRGKTRMVGVGIVFELPGIYIPSSMNWRHQIISALTQGTDLQL